MDILTINSLTKKYKKKLVLKDISLQLLSDKIYGLVGNNGVGKTTLIKCILGLIKPSQGEVTIFNEKAYHMSDNCKKKIGVVYDTPMFVNNMSGIDNMLYFCSPYGIENTEIARLYHHYAIKLNLTQSNQKVGEYSMGMKQKLSIIRGLIIQPQLFVLDEPFNGLDPSTRISLSKILQEFKNETKATVLISSHDLISLEELGEEFIYLENGTLEAFGDIKSITTKSTNSNSYKLVMPINLLEESIQKIITSNKLKIIDQTISSLTVIKTVASDQRIFEIISELNLPIDEIKRANTGLESLFAQEEVKHEN